MSCPSFSDIGKSARDIFKSGFHQGAAILFISAKSTNDIKFGGSLKYLSDFDEIKGYATSEIKTENYGKLIGKYQDDGTFSIRYHPDKNLFKNVDVNTIISSNPETNSSSVQFNSRYATDQFNTNCSLTGRIAESTFNVIGDFVYQFKNILFGYQAGYDTSANSIIANNIGLGFIIRDTLFHARCTHIPYEFGLSAHREVSNNVDVAINGIFAKKWRRNSQMWTLGIGLKYQLNESILRCKVDKDLQIGVSLQQRLYDVINLSLSFNIDSKNLQSGGHKVGLSLEIEA